MTAKHELDIVETLNLRDDIASDMKPSKIPDYDIEKLVIWTKHKQITEPDFKIVVLISDFESLNFGIINTMISIFGYVMIDTFRARKLELPIFFLFGVSSFDIFSQSIHSDNIILLNVERFQLKTNVRCVNELVSSVSLLSFIIVIRRWCWDSSYWQECFLKDD
jgi:hypothetical protein